MNADIQRSGRTPPSDILIVDANPNDLRALAALLEARGDRVRQVLDKDSAIAAMANKLPDLMVVDLTAPDSQGWDVCQHLKPDLHAAEIPLVFLSDRYPEQTLELAWEPSSTDYLTKPFEPRAAVACISRQLELRSLRHQLQEKNEKLEALLWDLKNVKLQLLQAQKISSWGRLAVELVNEVEEPMQSIHRHVHRLNEEGGQLLELMQVYFKVSDRERPEILQNLTRKKLMPLIERFPETLATMERDLDNLETTIAAVCHCASTSDRQLQKIDLNQGLDRALAMLRERLLARQKLPPVLLRTHYSNLPFVDGDREQLERVFLMLLANAISALEAKLVVETDFAPTIEISTRLIDTPLRGVEVCITDNGKGWNAEFEPERANRDTSHPGPEIGLSIAHSIVVDGHGGQLEYVPQRKEGTQVILRLPLRSRGV